MRISYRNNLLEKVLVAVNLLAGLLVIASFVCMFGFRRRLLPLGFLFSAQLVLLFVFVTEKVIRFFNAYSRREYLKTNWFEIPLLLALAVVVVRAKHWFEPAAAPTVLHYAVGIYLVVQVVGKLCRASVNLAASGRNPTTALIVSFVVLIVAGAGLLMLPRSAAGESIGPVDALFTATSATCVTGLVVKDTGQDFSLMGQVVILSLIQLGGLGIVVFGAVFALLLGQALTVRASVAMQDLLSARTLGRIAAMIAFIFVGTILIEALGALLLFGMWDDSPSWSGGPDQLWFYSIFHSVSAFCNAGFSLFSDSFIRYHGSWGIYGVVCPLIVLGGLGFGVLYELFYITLDRVKRFLKLRLDRTVRFSMGMPRRLSLQSKIVLCVSGLLIIIGTASLMLFEHYVGNGSSAAGGLGGALFQSVTARTAGFNTVDISSLSAPSQFILILLMFIGGSPGSTAGGIKTVTLAVVIMTAVATLRKRQEVEMFKRSVRIVVVGRAITVTLLFVAVLFTATLLLTITERANGFAMSQIAFEAASALGTVGLTTGITPSLTTAGKLIIIIVMLVGRLGPLTLLAAVTFNLKPARYNYPDEAIIVG